jgi:hypothetical protein
MYEANAESIMGIDPGSITLTPEMEALVARFANVVAESARIENGVMARELRNHFDKKFDEMYDYLDHKIEALRRELGDQIKEVRDEQDSQAEKLSEHGEILARNEVRMIAGDRKFDDHDCRLKELEGKETDNRVGLAKVIAGAGKIAIGPMVSAAVGAAVCMLLQGRAETPAKPLPAPIEYRQASDPKTKQE